MPRPKEHDERTAAALLREAERIVEDSGLEALSVRQVAHAVGSTTRAVYSLFGSKDGLVVALGARAFDLLNEALDALPLTDDPAGDLIEAGVVVFRRFALMHPALFSIGIQRMAVSSTVADQFRASQERALGGLFARVARVRDRGQLGTRSMPDAVAQFHALCEGLAALELRGAIPTSEAERIWRDGLRALVTGWCGR